ncbi:MAG TPA: hypothetical protein VFN26_14180 [Candidatus Acidoferrum sp.]|nr:hypothetical protein [Candidatus Acidoferrum sp.]
MPEAQQQQQVKYASKAQFDKLVAYVQELVKDHNGRERLRGGILRKNECET